ncbi:MAG TPA: PH domain-containing protein [Burkholderiales bacterium]|nr:PH domain-containing protein [Burkholderiales bacterium]
MENEEPVWSGSPSQALNLPVFVVCVLLCWLVVPVFYAIWKWLVLRNIRYELTTERLKIRQGVLNKQLDELELYRVRDYKLDQPLVLRLFSLGNITLRTADTSQPVVMLRAIRDGENVYEQIRKYVEECRIRKRVLPIDLEQA